VEISQGNSLCHYLKQKCHFFSFKKIVKQECEKGPVWELVAMGGKRRWGKGVRG
jgi:hypothetical protein